MDPRIWDTCRGQLRSTSTQGPCEANGGQINPFDSTDDGKTGQWGCAAPRHFSVLLCGGIKGDVWLFSQSGFGFYLPHGAEEEANNCESWQSIGLGAMGV